jgi:hypothetical protein
MKKLLIGLLLLSSPVMAEYKDGNSLYADMNSEGLVNPSVALGYVEGVVDVYQKTSVCIPLNVQAGQVLGVVKNYLGAHPESRHYSADSLVVLAAQAVWPCRNGKVL